MRIFFMVSSVEIHRASLQGSALVNSVIAPLPYKSAAEAVILLDHFEIILEVTRPVAHGMAVFAHDERLLRILRKIRVNVLQRRIHPAV